MLDKFAINNHSQYIPIMTFLYHLDLIALACQLPITALAWRREPVRDNVFWLLVAAAFLGSLLWTVSAHYSVWQTDLSAALWTSVTVTWGIFIFLSMTTKDAWRLVVFIAPILMAMGILAAIWSGIRPGGYMPVSLTSSASASLSLHIAVSVATYALVTIAASASCAGIIQDRALKAKQPTARSRGLPALSRCDEMMFRYLTIAEIVLALGLVTGIALHYQDTGKIISFDHKTILMLVTFSLIGIVLLAHRLSGLTGRIAARWALSAYFCLSLGYPGVKLAKDILLG